MNEQQSEDRGEAPSTESNDPAKPHPIRKNDEKHPAWKPTAFEQSNPDAFRLRYLPPEDLKPHPLNAQLYDERDDPDFEQSIKEQEIGQPIVATQDLTILSGHRRWRAALKVGLKRVPVRVLRNVENDVVLLIEMNRQRQKTREERLREAGVLEAELAKIAGAKRKAGQVRGGRVAGRGRPKGKDRSTPDLAETYSREERETAAKVAAAVGMKRETYKKARHVLKSKKAPTKLKEKLKKEEVSIDAAYRKTREIEKRGAQQADPDADVSGAPAEAKRKLLPKVIQGDARDELSKLRARSVSLIIIDGPGIVADSDHGLPGYRVAPPKPGPFDVMSEAEYQALMVSVLEQTERILTPDGSVYVFGDPRLVGELWDVVDGVGLYPRDILAWTHEPAGDPRSRGWKPAWQPIVHATSGKRFTWAGRAGHRAPNVIAAMGDDADSGTSRHPTVKPRALIERLVKMSTRPGEYVVDPFAGSGVTGDVCRDLGRRAVLVERDPRYAKMLMARFKKK